MIIDKRELEKAVCVLKSGMLRAAAYSGILVEEGHLLNCAEDSAITQLQISARTDTPFVLTPDFVAFLSKLPDGEIEILPQHDRMTVSVGTYRGKWMLPKADNYPRPKVKITGETYYETTAGNLREAITRTLPCVYPQPDKPVLTGIYLNEKEGVLCFTAMDGFALLRQKCEKFIKRGDAVFDAVLCAKGASVAAAMCAYCGAESDVKIYTERCFVVFEFSKGTVYARTLEGNYPDCDGFFPTENPIVHMRAEKNELIQTSERFAMLSAGANGRVNWDVTEGAITISAAGETASSTEKMHVDSYSALEDINFNMNSGNVIKILKNLDGDSVEIKIFSKIRPVVFNAGQTEALTVPAR